MSHKLHVIFHQDDQSNNLVSFAPQSNFDSGNKKQSLGMRDSLE